ncbi:MAG: cupin domain-containing protein [Proteobacteria bacterium]|nr:cupin domain-containing protein [Pseudomonadota bacterium]MBU2261193.1 cupin domain-containing protein [Pseudomonadota bacterium]
MEIIDLKSREVFSHRGRGVAALVEEPFLKIRQVGLDPGKDVPVHTADAPVTIQVVRGEGAFSVGGESVRMGPGKLLRIPQGESMGIRNDSGAPLVFLVIKTPLAAEHPRESAGRDRAGTFVNLVDFAPIKPGKEEAFKEWFRLSSEVFAKHPGFIARTLFGPIEGGSSYAALVEHESKETFMDMHLSDDREQLFHQVEPLLLGSSKPSFYELLISHRR